MLAKDLLKEFNVECQIRKFSSKTIRSYYNNNLLFLNYCEKEFKITEVESIKNVHFKKYISFMMEKKLAETYINSIIKSFRAFFRYCVEEYNLKENPALKIHWQKEPKIIINAFNDKEVAKMLNVEGDTQFLTIRNRAILATLFDTGMRCSELCDLTTTDIKDTYIDIKNGKGDKERYVGISPQLQKYLTKYVREKQHYIKDKIVNNNYFFISRTGKQLTVTGIESIIEIAGKKANVREELRCSPHTCRHYFAQTQLQNGLDIYSLSRLLGHENINITKRYLQSLQDKKIIQMSIKTSPLMNL